jgi:hypothetical protein
MSNEKRSVTGISSNLNIRNYALDQKKKEDIDEILKEVFKDIGI